MIIDYFNVNPIISLFLIIGLGIALGQIHIKGFSLGSSGVIFIGIFFGHFGIQLPNEFKTLGIILFVYSLGLQTGPSFFRSIRYNGITYLFIALASLLSAASVVWICAVLFDLPAALSVGIFSGALTSTPGLAAASDILNDPVIFIGYGIAYPFGVIGVVIFVQLIANKHQTKEEISQEKNDPQTKSSKITVKQFIVTNPNCTGKPLIDINVHSMTQANITRVMRNDRVTMIHGDTRLQLNDIVRATGTVLELKKLEHLIGEETNADMDIPKDIVSRDVFISSRQITQKPLKELEIRELFGVILTRLSREQITLVPTGSTRLEIGDHIRIVGDREDCDRFVSLFGQQERRIHETNLLPLAIGMVVGAILGSYYFQFPGGFKFRLGMAGGPLLVALTLGHFGHIGPISTRVPYAAKYFTREIGLLFFLAVAGTGAGSQFLEVFRDSGLILLFVGAVVTIVPMLVAYLLICYLFRLGNLAAMGVICGAMTSTPALGVVTSRIDSETPTVAYASIYTIAIVLITICTQVLAMLLG